MSKLKDKQLDTALTRALKLISKMPKTEKEIKDYLYKKEYHKSEVEEALARLKELGYVNDENYVKMFIESKSKKYGHKMIDMKLAQKGIKAKVVVENESETAMQLAEKYMRNGNKSKEQLYRYLLSKGFDYNVCSEVIKDACWN